MTPTKPTASTTRVLLAGLIGNVMEWYDFAVYGYFATVIGREFFPSSDPASSLIGAFGAFAAGFLVRPLGGVVFGRIGDLFGRRRALSLSVMAMAIPTVLMGVLPTHQQIGVAAPIAVVVLRLIQGLSVGGEYTSSSICLSEHAPRRQRGFYAIWGLWGSVLGMLLGSGFGDLLAHTLTPDQLGSWGWRLPFVLGALVAFTGIVIRQGIGAEVIEPKVRAPVRETFGRYRLQVLQVMALNIASSVGYYATFVYAVSYLEDIDNFSDTTALSLNTGILAVLLLLYPIAAWLSDRIGRKPMLISGSALMCFGALSFFDLMHSTDPQLVLRGELGLTIAVALLAGGKNPANVELMPAAVRCTGLAVAFNIAEGYFGGTTPLIATWLISRTGNPMLPGAWVALAGLITLITAVFFTRETAFRPLEESP